MQTITEEEYEGQEKKLIEGILNGGEYLFDNLVQPYYEVLYKVIESYLPDHDEVAGILQTTLEKAYKELELYDSQNEFSHWLINIAINEAQSKANQVLVGDISSTQDVDKIEQPFNLVNASSETIDSVKIKDLYEIQDEIEKLPQKFRIIYSLKMFAFMRNKEIAKCLSISKAEVKSAINAAKVFLVQRRKSNAARGYLQHVKDWIKHLKATFDVTL